MLRRRILFVCWCFFIYGTLSFGVPVAQAVDTTVDVSQASEAELDGLKGIGPALSRRILEARDQAPFQDWNDFLGRVSGVGPRAAARLSQEGLRVNGQTFDAAQGKPTRAPKPAAQAPAR